jgi:hypothetical protein
VIYTTINGQTFEADSPEELVSQLRESSWVATKDDGDFMYHSSLKAAAQIGKTVRCDTAANYVADLVANGLLKESEKGK